MIIPAWPVSYNMTTRHSKAATRMTTPTANRLTPFLFLAVLLAVACGNEARTATEPTVVHGSTFGTFYQITLSGDWSEPELGELQAGVEEVLEDVDRTMSTYRDDSELNRLSGTPTGEWVTVSGPLYQVLSISQEVARATDGAFDITVGGVVRRWGFGPDQRRERTPSAKDLEDALDAVGHAGLELDPEQRMARRTADFELDVSATAKGYGIDAVAGFLDDQGIGRYLVNIGGDMRAGERPSSERAWRVGIQQPDDRQPTPMTIVPLEHMAITTSGDYRNYYEEDGQRYSHLIDPRTGRPVDHRLASVTVLHPLAARADAFATGLMILGPDDAMAVAEEQKLKVLLIVRGDDGFRTRTSPALRAYLDRQGGDRPE